MTKVLRATITFEYLVDGDELMSEMSDVEQVHYVRESTVEDIMSMGFGNSDDLYESINVEEVTL
tara:strand:- start:464 stop:655 length:192 start_codon:yes stop_codon:yes gene_type:complete